MKKILSFILVLTIIASTAIFFSIPASAKGGAEIVYVSATGTDRNDGLSADAPIKTFSRAIEMVADNGTIYLVGTVSAGKSWRSHDKTVNITGGTLDFTTMDTRIYLEGHVKFDNVTLNFREGDELYANAHTLYIGENTKLTARISVFGGGFNYGTTVTGDAHVTVLAGDYIAINGGGQFANLDGSTTLIVGGTANAKIIRGGGYGGIITGSTYVWVGDSANPKCDPSLHSGDVYYIWGAGYNCLVKGSSTLEFTGNAKANYIYGGTEGADQPVEGGTNVIMSGGTTMSVYGGNAKKDTNSDAHIVMTGGTVEQVFGANNDANLTGNVTIELLGGKITRRVYGGCYNDTSGTSFATSYAVNGKITLIIDSNVTIDFTSSSSDRSIYAHSRHNSPSSDEYANIVFTNAAAYNKYQNKLKAQDTTMKYFMSGVSAADFIHSYTYTLSGNVITQQCQCGNNATATLVPTSTQYTGKAVTVVATYSENWEGEELTLTYANNVEVGTATVDCKLNGDGVTYSYAIAERADIIPGDANDDGKVDVSDITMIFRYLYNSKVYEIGFEGAADVNKDGKITALDLLSIFKSIQ